MTDHRSQILAVVLICVGLFSIGCSDACHWTNLSGAGLTVIGLGGGILTGKAMGQLTNKEGGTINVGGAVNPPSEEK